MKRILFSIVVLLCPFYGDCQASFNTIDSLHVLLEKATTDEDRIDVYLGLSRANMLGTNHMEEAFEMANIAYDLALSIGSKRYQADAMCFIGMTKRGLMQPYVHHFKEAYEIAVESGDGNSILFAAYLHTEYYINQPDKGIDFLEPLIAQFKDEAWNKTIGNCYKVLAWQYEQMGDYATAEVINLRAIDLFIAVGDTPSIDIDLDRPSSLVMDRGKSNLRQVYIYLSELYSKMGRFDDAILTAQKGYISAQDGDSEGDMSWTTMRLGGIYKEVGKYQDAIELYSEAITNIRTHYSPQSAVDIYLALGDLFMEIGELEEAEKRYHLAYNIGQNVTTHVGDILLSLADVNYRQLDYELAASYYIEADSIFLALDANNDRIESQLGLAKTQIANGLYETADQRLKKVLVLAKQVNNDQIVYEVYITMAIAAESSGDMVGALQYGTEAYNIAQHRSEELELSRSSHEFLSRIHEKLENFQTSLYHRKKYQVYNDSLFSEMTIQKLKQEQVSQNVTEYIQEKDSAQQLSAALKSQNTLYILLSSLLSLLLVGGTYLVYQLRKSRVKVELQNAELNELNATKDRFFGIIAHDIRSPIAALQSVHTQMDYYAAKGKTNKLIQLSAMVGGTAQRLNSLLDNLLNWAMLQTKAIPYHPVTLQLSKIVQENIELFHSNASNKEVHIEMNISERIKVTADLRALETILRNLLSNAIKYSNPGDTITIGATPLEDIIAISIQDTGVGMTSAQLESVYDIGKKSEVGTKGEAGTGLGLVLIHELVALNKGEMMIESVRGEGTCITIKLATAK